MKKTLLAILLAAALTVIPAAGVFADNPATVTVTATPYFISIDLGSVDSWAINGIANDGLVRTNTTYYANTSIGGRDDTTVPLNPVVDDDCRFTFTNAGTVNIDITCNFEHFTTGDAMHNSHGGYLVNGANDFGASGYASGAAWAGGAVTFDSSGSGEFIDNLGQGAPNAIKWGVAFLTQTGAFTSGTVMNSNIVCTAVEHS